MTIAGNVNASRTGMTFAAGPTPNARYKAVPAIRPAIKIETRFSKLIAPDASGGSVSSTVTPFLF
jgi:hypothetical protein